jgi:CRISPR/Cas system-associated endoribonuclease Cas2
MGLDMYLYAKLYTSRYDNKELNDKLWLLFKDNNLEKIDNITTIELKFEQGYWRKANAIHRWFVRNIQNSIDDCREYTVSRDDLKKLLDICKKIKDNNELSVELLPTETGFFFGNVEYDEWYFGHIDITIEIIDRCLKLSEDFTFEYTSSW